MLVVDIPWEDGGEPAVESTVERAVALNLARKGNCSQALLCAYAKSLGLDDSAAYALGEGMASGFGDARGTCGAYAAACVIIGARESNRAFDMGTCGATAGKVHALAGAFLDEVARSLGPGRASLVCGEILRGERPPEVPCWKVIRAAARAVEQVSPSD